MLSADSRTARHSCWTHTCWSCTSLCCDRLPILCCGSNAYQGRWMVSGTLRLGDILPCCSGCAGYLHHPAVRGHHQQQCVSLCCKAAEHANCSATKPKCCCSPVLCQAEGLHSCKRVDIGIMCNTLLFSPTCCVACAAACAACAPAAIPSMTHLLQGLH